jgi:hypothetical protein
VVESHPDCHCYDSASFVSDFSTGIWMVFMVTRFAWLISSLVSERRHNLRLYRVWDSVFTVLYSACLFLT